MFFKTLPVSRFPMMVSSPNLALLQRDSDGTCPSLSKLRNSHDLVVCSFLPLFGNTEITFGFSVFKNTNIINKNRASNSQ